MISYPFLDCGMSASTNKSSDLTEFAYYSLSCFKINFMSSNIHKVIKWIS